MKKRFTLIIIASLLMFNGASPWEGAAVVAPNGEMPPVGLFIATNAFPRNTVVDVTNIETGKSTRAIVSNSLTNPGLLAVVSHEAAELIGMRAGSVSRIRMVQPADPIANMRFSESVTANNDFGNVIDEESLAADLYGDDTYTPPDGVNEISDARKRPPSVPGYIIDEPEWGGRGKLQIVDVPDYNVEPVEQFTERPPEARPPETNPPEANPSTARPSEVSPPEENPPEAHPSMANPPETNPSETNPSEAHPSMANPPVEHPPAAQILPVTESIDEPEPVKQNVSISESEQGKESKQDIKEPSNFIKEPLRDIVKDVSPKIEKNTTEPLPELPRNEVAKAPDNKTETPNRSEVVDKSPLQEKVEVAAAPVQQTQQPETPKQEQPQQPQSGQKIFTFVEAEQRPPPSNVYDIDKDFISDLGVKPSGRPNTPVVDNKAPVTNPNLPNTIDRLERGKYYVQVAVLPADLVENTLRQINPGFNPLVFKGTNNMHHIFIGPLNQGESAAVLARFKSIGYKDAVVRVGG